MGLKFPGTVSKKDKFLTTQDVGRMAKFANDLQTSSDPRAAPFKKKGIQLLEHKGAVYIVPAKPGSKSAARRHEKALLYFADHFGSQANQRTYGHYGKDGKNSNAIRAQEQLLAQRNKGSLTLDELCGALTPVSNAQRCKLASKLSHDVVERSRKLQWRPNQHAAEVASSDWSVGQQGSDEFQRAVEWSVVFTREYQRAAESPEFKKALAETFEKNPAAASPSARNECALPAGMTLGTLQQKMLVAPQERINLLLSQVHDAHEIDVVWSDAKRDETIVRRSEELLKLVQETIENQARMGRWLIEQLAPHLPGRLGQAAAAWGVSLVELSLANLSPDSEFMGAAQWASQNLAEAQNRMAARRVGERAEGLNQGANEWLLSLDSPFEAVPVEPPPMPASLAQGPAAAKAWQQRYEEALTGLEAGVERIDDWLRWGQLPSQAGKPDAQLNDRLNEAWASFANNHGFDGQDPFDLLLTEFPSQLQDEWDRLMRLSEPAARASSQRPIPVDHEAILECSRRIVELTAVYQKGLAVMGHGLMAGVLADGWSYGLQRDGLEWGNHLLDIGEMLADPDGPAMAMVAQARRLGSMAGAAMERKVQRTGYLGKARHDATVAKAQRRDTVTGRALEVDAPSIEIESVSDDGKAPGAVGALDRRPRRLSEAANRELDDIVAQLSQEDATPPPRRRAVSQDSATKPRGPAKPDGKRVLLRRAQSRADRRWLDEAITERGRPVTAEQPSPTEPTPTAQGIEAFDASHPDTPRPGRSVPQRRRRVTAEKPKATATVFEDLPQGALHRPRGHRGSVPNLKTPERELAEQDARGTRLPSSHLAKKALGTQSAPQSPRTGGGDGADARGTGSPRVTVDDPRVDPLKADGGTPDAKRPNIFEGLQPNPDGTYDLFLGGDIDEAIKKKEITDKQPLNRLLKALGLRS